MGRLTATSRRVAVEFTAIYARDARAWRLETKRHEEYHARHGEGDS